MNDTIITCVYCGQVYPANTPTHGADVKVLTEHIKVCPKHPMSALVAEKVKLVQQNKQLRDALERCSQRWKWFVRNPKAPVAGIASMDGAVEKADEILSLYL